ncbi:MAG: hypothetical protein ACHQ50_10100 [Fimbriimonadales bacterium]
MTEVYTLVGHEAGWEMSVPLLVVVAAGAVVHYVRREPAIVYCLWAFAGAWIVVCGAFNLPWDWLIEGYVFLFLAAGFFTKAASRLRHWR